MLTRLHIQNLAVLDAIELDLAEGFSALTGETGAGKSMLVDALALALGGRADSTAVRGGTPRAEVTAVFDLDNKSGAALWLRERDLDAEPECQLRRVITGEGRSRGYINGQPVPMETLRELGEQLVEICGQHAHQSLLRRATQREILDAHGGHTDLVNQVAAMHRAWSLVEDERRSLTASRRDRDARADLLGYQVSELEALNLQAGEVECLERERLLLANLGRVSAGLATALERIYDAEQASAHDSISSARRELEALAVIDPELGPAVESLIQAGIEISDAAERLRRRLASLEHDPQRQEAVESRIASALELARKHRVEPEALWSLAESLKSELAGLTDRDTRLQQIVADATRLNRDLLLAAAALTTARQKAAGSLAAAVTKNLHSLGMTGSSFAVRVEPVPEEQTGANGRDQVEFLVSTNAGQPLGPIARVASGGELSRLSLAIQVVAMGDHAAATLIFDEVDAGIGGGVAEIVGQCLKRLSRQHQVLCVTHLPQVASQADHHYAVTKSSRDDTTRAAVRELGTADRVDEVARMLGGVKITERTRAHASEMLHGARPRRAG